MAAQRGRSCPVRRSAARSMAPQSSPACRATSWWRGRKDWTGQGTTVALGPTSAARPIGPSTAYPSMSAGRWGHAGALPASDLKLAAPLLNRYGCPLELRCGRFSFVAISAHALRDSTNMLSRFTVVLLDMNGTFMFGGDRFGPEQDFAATYHALGGRGLAAQVVQDGVLACFETLGEIYDDSARCDSFPNVLETLRDLPTTRNLPENELKLLERVIAEHELGTVSETYALSLKRLAATHRLGVIANIISRKEPWLSEFGRAGVLNLFATTVFSSDSRSVKPSQKLFEQALGAIGAPRSEVVFVGDSLRCDIGGAAGAGLASVWIDRAGRGRGASDPEPTFVIGNLLELIDS